MQTSFVRLTGYDKKKMKTDFDDEELIRIASFYLNYGKKDLSEHATIDEAKAQIGLWNK